MKADTVELLVTKAHFPAEQALAVAEAIDMEIQDSQLVTVPILDARFAAFQGEMNKRFAEVDVRFVALEARIDQKFERFRLHLIIAILAGYGAMGPLGAAVLDAIRRAL